MKASIAKTISSVVRRVWRY